MTPVRILAAENGARCDALQKACAAWAATLPEPLSSLPTPHFAGGATQSCTIASRTRAACSALITR